MAATQQEVIEQITEQAMAAMRTQEDGDVSAMLDAFQAAHNAILMRIQAVFPGEEWTLVNMQGTRIAALMHAIDQEIYALNAKLTAQTTDAVAQQFQDSQAWSAYALDQATPANVSINFIQPPLPQIKALLSTPFQGAMFSQRYGAIGDAMASDIRDQLTQSMINGETMQDAAARLDDVMGEPGEGFAGRTEMIARTEIMRASNLGAYDVYQNQNKDLMQDSPEWYATADDRLCPWCLGRDGHTEAEIRKLHLRARGKSDPFQGSATMPLHPHCRCRWLPRLKTWKDLGIDIPDEAADDARSMRNEAGKWVQAPVQTFDQWKLARSNGMQLGVAP